MSRTLGSTVVLTGVAALFGCGGPPPAPPTPPPPQAGVIQVVPTSVDLGPAVAGRFEGSREVEVRARVAGIVAARTFEEGDRVRAGQLLFRIDPAEYEADLRLAQARLAQADAELARAEREKLRLEPLVATRAASQKSLDEALSTADLARAAKQAAAASVDQAKLRLSWTTVTAPIEGLVSRAIPSEGSLVEPGDNSLLTRIVRIDPLWVRFALPAAELAAVRAELGAKPLVGIEVELSRADGTVLAARGRLDFVDVRVDESLGTVALRAEIANADGILLPGEFVRVRLLGVVRENAIVVPQRAVQQGREGRFVLVLENGVAAVRPVEVGTWVGADWVVTSGLSAGDQVIVDGIQKVRPGSPVTVAPASPSPPVPQSPSPSESTAPESPDTAAPPEPAQ